MRSKTRKYSAPARSLNTEEEAVAGSKLQDVWPILRLGFRALEDWDVGGLMIQEPIYRPDNMPLGGWEQSGLGRGRDSLCDGGND